MELFYLLLILYENSSYKVILGTGRHENLNKFEQKSSEPSVLRNGNQIGVYRFSAVCNNHSLQYLFVMMEFEAAKGIAGKSFSITINIEVKNIVQCPLPASDTQIFRTFRE